MNESLVGPHNSGQATVGMEFSNRLRPTELLAADHAVPVQVPRIRYEVITKKVRNGDDPPIANAGPDQVGVTGGLITLNEFGFVFSGWQPHYLPVDAGCRSAGNALRADFRDHDFHVDRRREIRVYADGEG